MGTSIINKIFAPSLAASADLEILLEAMRARELMLNKKNDSAKQICDRLISSANWDKAKNSIKVFVLNVRGMACQQLKLLDCAIADFQKTREIEPGNLIAIEHLGEIFPQTLRFSEAKDCLDLLIATDPETTAAKYINRASVLLKLQNPTEALHDCEAALKIDPDSLGALQNAAVAYSCLGNFAAVISHTDRMVQLNPKFGAGFYLRGNARASLGDEAEALKDYANAIECGYTLAGSVYLVRGELFIKSKQFDKALADCEKALELKSDDAAAFTLKARVLTALSRLEDALKAYQSALECAPSGSAKARAHVNLCTGYLRIGDSTSALLQCDLALAEDQNIGTAYNNRAWILAHLGKLDEALTTIEIAMNMQPVSANTQATRGLILYLLGRTEEAKRDFDEALAKNSAIAEALYCRAAILEKSGLTEQATQDYSQAMKLEFKLPPFSTYSLGLGPFAWHKPDAENSTDT